MRLPEQQPALAPLKTGLELRGLARTRGTRKRLLAARIWTIWEVATTVLTSLSVVYLVLLTLEPTRRVLEPYVGPVRIEMIAAVMAVTLELVLVALYQLGRRVESARAAILPPQQEKSIYDVGEIFPELRRLAPDKKACRRVEILGLTLGSTWSQVESWLTSSNPPSDIRISLYCLDPEFVAASTELPDIWIEESRRTQEKIRLFTITEKKSLAHRRMSISLREYACVPIVHGFRFGDGTVFISYLQWSGASRIRPFPFYERIFPTDTTLMADRYRELFDSWVTRVRADVPTEDGSPKGSGARQKRITEDS